MGKLPMPSCPGPVVDINRRQRNRRNGNGVFRRNIYLEVVKSV